MTFVCGMWLASESASQTEVCLQVLGIGIVISECQDLHCLRIHAKIIFKRTLNTENTITESTLIYRFASWCRTFIYRCASWCQTRPPQSCYSESIPSTHGRWRRPGRKGSFWCKEKWRNWKTKKISRGNQIHSEDMFYPYTKHQGTVGGLGRETALIGKIQNFKICKG